MHKYGYMRNRDRISHIQRINMHALTNARKHRNALVHLNMDSKHKPQLYDCQSRIRKLMNDNRQMFIHCSLIHFGSHNFLQDYIA